MPQLYYSKKKTKRHVPHSFVCDQKKTALSNLNIIASYSTAYFKVFFNYFHAVVYKSIMLSNHFSVPLRHSALTTHAQGMKAHNGIIILFQC
jgi:hypothetical protein